MEDDDATYVGRYRIQPLRAGLAMCVWKTRRCGHRESDGIFHSPRRGPAGALVLLGSHSTVEIGGRAILGRTFGATTGEEALADGDVGAPHSVASGAACNCHQGGGGSG